MPTFTPPDTAHLWSQLDGSALAGSNGSAVASWLDASGHARHATGTGSTTLLTAAVNGLNAVRVVSTSGSHAQFTVPIDTTLAADAASVYVLCRPRNLTNALGANTTPANSAYFGRTNTTPALGTYWAGNTDYARINAANTTGWMVLHLRISLNGTAPLGGDGPATFFYHGGVDGWVEVAHGKSLIGFTAGGQLQFPQLGLFNDQIDYAEALVYATGHSYATEQAVLDYFHSKWNAWRPSRLILLEGNSTTEQSNLGYYLAPQFESFTPAVYTTAISSTNTAQMVLRVPMATEAVTYWGGLNSYAVYHTGHNDGMLLSTLQPSFTGVGQTSPNQTVRNASGRALICTASQWNNSLSRETGREGVPGTLGAAQAAWGDRGGSLNNWIRRNWSSCFDAFVDLGASHEFGVYDDGTSPAGTSRGDFPTLWADEVHPTGAGQAAKALILAPALSALMAVPTLVNGAAGDVRVSLAGVPSGWSVQWSRYTSTPPAAETATRGTALTGQTTTNLSDTSAAGGATYWYTALMTAPSIPYAGLAYGVRSAAWSRPFRVDVPATSTSVSLSGPTSGVVARGSTPFTVAPNGPYTGVFTPTSTGSGVFAPSALTWTGDSAPKTFTYTPGAAAGSPHLISGTTNPPLSGPAAVAYAVTTLPAGLFTAFVAGGNYTVLSS